MRLKVHGHTWQLNPAEPEAVAVFIAEMQAAHQRPVHEA